MKALPKASELSASLKKFVLSLGFDDIGICKVDGSLPFIEEFKTAAKNGRFGPLDYLHNTLEKRLDLRSFFPKARFVIIVVKNYYTGDHNKKNHSGKIARYAWGKDYHQWFKKRLKKISNHLVTINGDETENYLFNDTGPFIERSWAHKAGLGFIGKSAMFIHRKYGTWTLLGGLATNANLISDAPYIGPNCGSCTRCIDACPTKAIVSPFSIDANKCISTWTIERTLHKDAAQKAPRNHEWVFGCDVCQEVCPWNKFQVVTNEERFLPIMGRVYLNKETFKQSLFGSPLNRTRKVGLLANFMRIRKTLNKPGIKHLY